MSVFNDLLFLHGYVANAELAQSLVARPLTDCEDQKHCTDATLVSKPVPSCGARESMCPAPSSCVAR